MIPYEDLCRALDQDNARRRNADEMAQLDSVPEDPAEPAFQDVAAATDPEVALAETAPEHTESAPQYTDPSQATLNEPVVEAEPEAFAESAPEQQPADQVSAEEPTVQAPLDMGPTDQQVFTPGSEMPYDTSQMASTAENEMPYMEEPTDVTPIEPVPEQAPVVPEETTQEFDIEEAEEVVEKEPQ